jgi:two-component system NarL family response regulator
MPIGHKEFSPGLSFGHWPAHTETSYKESRVSGSNKRSTSSVWNAQSRPGSEHDNEKSPTAGSTRQCDDLLTVLVADDHPVVREGLMSLINRHYDMRVIAQASNGREAVDQYFRHRPSVALLDLRMCVMDGITALISICERHSGARIAIISSYELEEDIYRVLRAGAMGYILKDATEEQLSECLRSVAKGKIWLPPLIGAKLAKRVADRELTPREIQVLGVVAAGKSNKEIATALNISEATVKVHITHVLEKLKVTGRTEAINVALKRGLVHLDVSVAA